MAGNAIGYFVCREAGRYGRVLLKLLRKYPPFRSRGESWAFRTAAILGGLIPSAFAYWRPGSWQAVIVPIAVCFVPQPLIGAWWLYRGRDLFPLSPAAVERMEARPDRTMRRQTRRTERWRERPLV